MPIGQNRQFPADKWADCVVNTTEFLIAFRVACGDVGNLVIRKVLGARCVPVKAALELRG